MWLGPQPSTEMRVRCPGESEHRSVLAAPSSSCKPKVPADFAWHSRGIGGRIRGSLMWRGDNGRRCGCRYVEIRVTRAEASQSLGRR